LKRGSPSTLTFFLGLSPLCVLLIAGSPMLYAQRPGTGQGTPSAPTTPSTTLTVNVRDTSGTPLDTPALVTLHGSIDNASRVASAQGAAGAIFEGIPQGEYEAQAKCVGYVTTSEHITVTAVGSIMTVYIYLPRESEAKPDSGKPKGTIMSPKLQAEIDKGIDALRKRQFEEARNHFAKGAKMAPGNPDVAYLLGVAESGLQHPQLALENFQHALSLNPNHARALLALGELQLNSGDSTAATTTLEKAFQVNGADWRTHFLLASAYGKTGRLAEAESHAQRAVALARDKSAEPLLLLGEIQLEEGKIEEARQSWQKLAEIFPAEPAALKAREKLNSLSSILANDAEVQLASLPFHALPALELEPVSEQPWAPPDIDSVEYPVTQKGACQMDDVLNGAEHRLDAELKNFEKFSANEHIEHQDVDRYGQAGPPRTRDFSYIVLVHRYQENSFYLEEERMPLGHDDSFPTSLATTGLNNLGVAILQPAERENFVFSCEGLSTMRKRPAWQIRFEEKKGAKNSIRHWRRNGQIFDIPLKGRLWVASGSFDILRIETDLLGPVEAVGLTRDHLAVDYGPVRFASAGTSLWLPWNADVYMELHQRRYHQRHALSDYTLFEVDTAHKIGRPKEMPPPAATPDSPAPDPQ